MRKRFFQLFIAFVCAGNSSAQITANTPGDIGVNENPGNHAFVEDGFGKPVKKSYAEQSHTPYFNEEYKFANIKLARGRAFVNVKTRIDLLTQETSFISSNGIEIKIDPGLVKEITYADTTKEGIIFYKFQTGFPTIDRQNGNNFYLVLAEGRCSFIKSIYKKIKEKVVVVFSEAPNDFETYENYYLFAKGEIKKLKKDKDFFLVELADKQAEVNQFIQSNKTNFKNNEHLIKLLNYYNSL